MLRRILSAVLFSGLVLAAVYPAQAAGKEEAAVRATIEKVYANWASLNAASNDALYAPDAQLAFFDLAPMKYDSWAAYKEGSQKLLDTYKELKLNLNNDMAVHVAGKVAWVTGTWTGDGMLKDGKAQHLEGRYTDILEKRGGKWIVVHEHFSVPAQM